MKTAAIRSTCCHLSIAQALALSSIVALGQPVVIDFEGLPGMTFYSRNPIPPPSQLSQQLVPGYGVSFSSGSPYVAVVDLGYGHATSGTNGIGGSTPGGILTYSSAYPIVATFSDPAHPSTPAVTDFVSVRIDQCGGSGLTVRLNAFDVTGSLIGFATSLDIGGATLQVSTPGIHSVQFIGTIDDAGAALDDFTFNPLTPIPEPPTVVFAALSSLVAFGFHLKRRQGERRTTGTEEGVRQ